MEQHTTIIRLRKNSHQKPEAFVHEDLVDINAAQAAIRAGCSLRMAKEIGYDNLTKPQVAVAVAQARQEARDQVQ